MRDAAPDTLTHGDLPFTMIPEWVLFHPQLTSNAVRLYGVLMRHANKQHRCWPGLDLLAAEIVASRSTVQRAMRELIDQDAISVTKRWTEHGDPDTNLYHVHWAPPTRDGGSPAGDTTPTGEGGWPAGDPRGGPPVTRGWPAGDAQTRAKEREQEEREPEASLQSPTPAAASPYLDWERVCVGLGWNPKLNTATGIKKLKELKAAGISVEEVIDCGRWLQSDPWWAQRGVDIFKVQGRMQAYKTRAEPARPTLQDEYETTVRELRGIFGED